MQENRDTVDTKRYKPITKGPLIISAVYFCFGFLWIFFSDRILLSMNIPPEYYAKIQTWKGWIYVTLTTLIIYILLKVYSARQMAVMNSLKDKDSELEQTLKGKELLLNEVHHRVKNNLQMIISLIYLKTSYTGEENLDPVIQKITEQLYSLALIHDKLEINNAMAVIDFAAYLTDFTEHQRNNYQCPENMRLDFDIETVFINIEKAIPCGLIINEILSNSCKHAFRNNEDHIISIKLKKAGSDAVISIADNGPGFDFENRGISFGLNLVPLLSKQIGARSELTSKPGETRHVITIPDPEKAPEV